MSAACGATMVMASIVHRASPWAGLNAMATAAGLHVEPMHRFDRVATPLGLGILSGGLFAWAGLYELALSSGSRRAQRPTIGKGLLAGAAAFAFDRFVLRREVVPSFLRTLGPAGTLAKYGALSAVAATC